MEGRHLEAVKSDDAHQKLANVAGKLQWGLLPWEALKPCVRALEFGTKYGAEGWKTVPNAPEVYKGSLLRHVLEFAGGQWKDPETGLPHLAHAVCNALFLIWLEANDRG